MLSAFALVAEYRRDPPTVIRWAFLPEWASNSRRLSNHREGLVEWSDREHSRWLGKAHPMPFTVCGKHPGGRGHSEFTRETVTGAIFKAADLIGDGWTSVHICDESNQIYWPDRFHLVSKSNA